MGGPEVAEHGDVLRAPGGTVVVTAIATGAAGGDDGAEGADGVVLWVVGDPRKGKCDMVCSPPGMLDRRSLLVTVSIIHSVLFFLRMLELDFRNWSKHNTEWEKYKWLFSGGLLYVFTCRALFFFFQILLLHDGVLSL